MIFNLNVIKAYFGQALNWMGRVFNTDNMVKMVSRTFSSHASPLTFRGKIALLRTFWPINGGIDIERQVVDEQGNRVIRRTTGWVGSPPFRGEGGLVNRGYNQV
jgi:hypothetical protein